MDRLGEVHEEEEEEELLVDIREQPDPATRAKELATQKARIVSQMAGMGAMTERAVSPKKRIPSTGERERERERTNAPLSSAMSVPVRTRTVGDAVQQISKYPMVATQETARPKEPRISLFDVIADNIVDAVALAATDLGFHTPREYIMPQILATHKLILIDQISNCTRLRQRCLSCLGWTTATNTEWVSR
jgi:hypothetical protein